MSKKNDDYLRLLASMEQAAAGLKPIAHVLHVYFEALVEQGFHRDEALSLTKEFQAFIIAQGLNQFGNSADDES